MNKTVLYASIGALIAFLISAVIISSYNLINNSLVQTVSNQETNSSSKIFTNQSATFEGTIVNHSDKIVELKSQNNVSETFPLSDNLLITKFSSGKNEAITSNKPEDIELNKNVSIIFNMIDNQYQIVNITYIPDQIIPIVPPLKQASQSANVRP